MQVSNPLVPPSLGQPGAAPAPVANAPNVPDATQHQTPRPVTASKESERSRNDADRRPADAEHRPRRGRNVDLTV